ncbi:MAG: hypothetical protein AUI21_03420 [Nitrospirae bacterium 13_1_40CM_2_62_10]|nr:MAG: hypothetical protein AUH75_05130 [Gemmatimonadetes bacterium 13_1_40CM_4_65_7]OLD40824.1 MAG: hypothetical protein AUI21_03420 [Nitrospirae bacterium 13_1_40CM_2_62_10]
MADSYNDQVVAALRQHLEELSAVIRGDERAIRNLGLHHDAAEFDSWSTWLEQIDSERQQQIDAAFRDAATALVADRIQVAIRTGAYRAAALDPKTADRLIRRFQRLGIEDPLFLAAIRRFAAARDKKQAADAGLELLDGLGKARAIWDLHDLGTERESATWQAGADLFEIFIPDQQLQLIGKLTLSETRAAFYSVYEVGIAFPAFSAQVNGLENLTERRLKDLRALSTRIQADVGAKNRVSAELAAIDEVSADGGC